MKTIVENLNSAKRVFNTLNVIRGDYTSIATADKSGNPNVAPIGSMRITDEGEVHILQGFLPQTMQNLEEHPKAVFSACARQSLLDMLLFFRKKEDSALGWRVYGTLTTVSDAKEDIEKEVAAISTRVPFFMRKPFRKFCDKNLRRVLKFSIDDIRVIGGPI